MIFLSLRLFGSHSPLPIRPFLTPILRSESPWAPKRSKHRSSANFYRHFSHQPLIDRSSLLPSSKIPNDGLTLSHFLQEESLKQNRGIPDTMEVEESPHYLSSDPSLRGDGFRFFVETYGCQMNFSDSEIVHSVMRGAGYELAEDATKADIVLLNTCAIRDNAEQKVWGRLRELRAMKRDLRRSGGKKQQLPPIIIGVLGCMAERIKDNLLNPSEKLCQVVVGPDAYRDLPRLLARVRNGENAINVLLSADETYADVTPVRPADNQVSAYVSIMRGCNNMCSYCIVPFTRGRERSRNIHTILNEISQLSDEGFKEVILLGQNVNSFNDLSTPSDQKVQLAQGFKSIVKIPEGGLRFAELLDNVAKIDAEMRIRFTSPHPKDFSDDVLDVINSHHNICNSLHMPAQSGSSKVLEAMRRGYSRESYLQLIEKVKQKIPGCGISSDFIAGFCGESEEDHLQTLSLMSLVRFDMAYLFAYSVREKTHAHRTLKDDVPDEIKKRRLSELTSFFYADVKEKNIAEVGTHHLILIEGNSRKDDAELIGRTDSNKKVIISSGEIAGSLDATSASAGKVTPKVGDYVAVRVTETGVTMKAIPIAISSIREFSSFFPQPL